MSLSNLPKRPCITFLTDFGLRDTYVGQMKGVALGIHPDLNLLDLTHDIPPQQILQAAFIWNDAVDAFPAGTIHVGVVDPGVGSQRRLLAAEIGNQRFVCPDNGLLSVILGRLPLLRAVVLDNPRWWRTTISKTFHGRDILTPVAAAWSLGHDVLEFGSQCSDPPLSLTLADLVRGKTSLSGIVIDIDRFGNLMTNIHAGDLPQGVTQLRVDIAAAQIAGIASCYADVDPGEMLALIGSGGRLEVAIREGSAAEELQIQPGHRIVVRWKGMSE